jgi:hypothetical protein
MNLVSNNNQSGTPKIISPTRSLAGPTNRRNSTGGELKKDHAGLIRHVARNHTLAGALTAVSAAALKRTVGLKIKLLHSRDIKFSISKLSSSWRDKSRISIATLIFGQQTPVS